MERMKPPSLFVWGTEDTLVPIGFRKHVQKALPDSEHQILSCGHVPQMEMPEKTHARMREFLSRH